MTKKRWFSIIGGLAALCLVVAAVAWAATPVQETPLRTGGALRSGSADLGPTPAAPGMDEVADSRARPRNEVLVIEADAFDESPALRDIPSIEPVKAAETLLRWNETSLHPNDGSFDLVDPGLQAQAMAAAEPMAAMPAPVANFAGVNNVNGVLPPDTQGDVGPNHYVQWVNLAYAVYDKAGNRLLGPSNGNTIWSGFNGTCATRNDGDPITIYDHLADRWMMSQFQVNPTGSSYQCIAISTTPNPTGSWYRYQFTWPNNLMNDYPHFGLWPDAYYMTANQFVYATGAWRGAGVAAFEREKMLTGAAAKMVYFSLYSLNANYGGQLPADWEGTNPPPAGTPGLIMEWDDSTWLGTGSDALRIWKFHVDWTTPGNSYLGTGAAGSAGGPNWTISTNNVDPTVCSGTTRSCIDQPGTTVGLDAISDRLMHRVQYRNFGSHQALVGNHTVDTNSPAGTAGIHWFELRNTGTDWTMHQQGTYGPSDGLNRWMGSIAMDGAGNMAMGYSVSGASVYPGIRYVGRLAGDPLGVMGQSETTLINGGGYQSHSASRWGDYSAMQVDPADDATFWFTTEYMASSSSAGWVTRIGAFRFGQAVNQPPVANPQSLTTPVNMPLNITLTGSDPNGDPLTYAVATQPTKGTLSGSAPNLTYTPTGATGADSFTFTVNDGQATSAPATISINVTAVNNPPVANAQSKSTNEDTAVGVTLTGSDPDGNPLTFAVATQPANGALSGTAPDLTYTPAANYNGADSFTFTVSDGQATSAPATVNLTVSAVNDAPVANPQTLTAQVNVPLAITLAGSDVDGDPLTYTVVSQPSLGTLSGTTPNLSYTAGSSGSTSFTFKVNDGTVDSAVATVSITVMSPDVVWLSLSADATLSGIGAVNDEDIVALDKATGVYSWVFDGSDVGITGDIDAFDVLDNGHILMSFDATTNVTGVGSVTNADMVEFTPTSLGPTTAGTFAWKFDASDVGLSTLAEDVDAVFFLADGSMLVSTRGSVSVTGVSAANADLLRFAAATWGSTTAGTWSWYFDGSDVGLSSANENVDGVWLDQTVAPNPAIYLSSLGNFSVPGVSGQNDDIFVFQPAALGSSTSGSYNTTLFLDGGPFGLGSYDIDAFDVRR